MRPTGKSEDDRKYRNTRLRYTKLFEVNGSSRRSAFGVMDQNFQKNTVKIKLTSGIVDAVIVSGNRKTIWVRLPDGNVIKRHRLKHLMS